MTLPKEIILRDWIRGLQKKDTSIIINASFYPHREGKKGQYLYLFGMPEMYPEEDNISMQFLGVHECLCLTLRRPALTKGIIRLAYQFRECAPLGPITWLGPVECYRRRGRKRVSCYIPRTVWDPPNASGSYTGTISTKGIIHPITAGRGGFEYWVLQIPAIRRERIDPLYIIET